MATIAPQNTKMGDPLRQKKAKIAFSGLTENGWKIPNNKEEKDGRGGRHLQQVQHPDSLSDPPKRKRGF